MSTIDDFPKDDKFWVIKWVDEFCMPHRTPDSTAVSVLLQELPFSDQSRLSTLKAHEVQAILGKKFTAPPLTFYRTVQGKRPTVHAGSMPLLSVGLVYQNQELVGELPPNMATIVLPEVEVSCDELDLQTAVPAPPGWPEDRPHKLLNEFEFAGVRREFGRSRCLVFHDNDIEYIIPRSVIFKRFYAPQADMAKAFTNGPWPNQYPELIFTGTTKSGHTTGIDADTGDWHLILMPRIADDYLFLLATYYFDSYGKICAESIYSNSVRDRGANPLASWYASARIPFQASDASLRLDLKGYFLKPYGFTKGNSVRRKFLVTTIRGCSLPSYLVNIAKGRVNSGDTGTEVEESDDPAPYSTTRSNKPAGSETTVDSGFNADARTQARELPADEFFWIDPPEIKKLQKEVSTRYQPLKKPRPSEKNVDRTSLGNEDYKGSSLTSATTGLRQRDPSKRLESLMVALAKLKQKKVITSFSVVAPPKESWSAWRASRLCWNFLSPESRTTGVWPKRSWRLIEPAITEDGKYLNGIARAALVLRVTTLKFSGYWIEIEVKNGGYYSPFLYNFSGDATALIFNAIETIAVHRGSNLAAPLQKVMELQGGGSVGLYRHNSEKDKDGGFNLDRLTLFLNNPKRP
jgi:hypothetical protein